MPEDRAPIATRVRPEIQALRAVAVMAVVVYHLWPTRLSGGFVGVDVFFAISGFLITDHLLRAVDRGRLSLAGFWARRARRLLPAALTTIVVSGIAVVIWVPLPYWQQFFRELGAAALYVENWALAIDSVDYLAADNVPSPVQHFWSLSAEEQFYIVWPLLIAAGMLIARARATSPRRAILVILATVTAASLAWSIVQTVTEPSVAYFSTFTRAWEFGAGGLLAAIAPAVLDGRVRLRTAVSIGGWAMIGAAAVLYDSSLPFPSATAALPVAGALAVIWAGSDGLRITPTYVARVRPVQFIGDISYSVYLWHWPLIVLVPWIIGREATGAAILLGILAASLLLGWMSKRFIEDPVRQGVLARRPAWVSLVATASAMAVVVTGAGIGLTTLDRQTSAETATVAQLVADDAPCFGAAAHDPARPCDASAYDGMVLPSPATSRRDFSSDTWRECSAPDDAVIECVLGVEGGERVALIGDSHAHQWLPALEDLAPSEKWEIHLFVKGGCAFSSAVRVGKSGNCARWNMALASHLAAEEPFRIVFTSQRAEINHNIVPSDGLSPRQTAIAGFRDAWAPLIARGADVVAIHDVPDPKPGSRLCVSQNGDDLSVCDADPAVALRHDDYLTEAAEGLEGARVVDLVRFFCDERVCPAVIGGVLVNRDGDHATRTFVRTLAPYLLADSRL